MSRRLPFDPIAEARRLWEAQGWEDAAPGMAAVTSLMRAQQIVSARVEEVLRPYGLTFARYEVLMLLVLSRRGTLPMARIGERLQVPPPRPTSYEGPVLLVAFLAQHEIEVVFSRRLQADATLQPCPGTFLHPQTVTGPMLGRFSERSTNRPEPLSPTTSPSL